MSLISKNIHFVVAIIIATFIFAFNITEKFYGFEYEDAFISSSIASGENYFEKIINFRTAEFSNYIEGEGSVLSTYTGHYFPYSLYLFTINKIFNCPNYLIHKIGNFLLVLLSTTIVFLYKSNNRQIKFIFYCALMSSLPYIYIINSSLIENLSFFFGLVFIVLLRYNSKNEFGKCFLIVLLIILSIIKRENLYYFILCPLFIKQSDFTNLKYILLFTLFLSIQLILNPFYTEGLESLSIKSPTFSLSYLKFQLPTYLYSLISFKGFLLLTVSLLVIKFSKKSAYLLFTWLGFIMLYSFHYRSRYAVSLGRIELFDTYRYVVNTIPFLFGVLIFSDTRSYFSNKKWSLTLIPIASLIFFYNSLSLINDFIEDEYLNFHKVNDDLIKRSANTNIRVYDNFVLISILNMKEKKGIDIYELHEYDEIIKLKNTFIINRFQDFELEPNKNLTEIKELSTSKTKVYTFYN
jgi:hypothetical protein